MTVSFYVHLLLVLSDTDTECAVHSNTWLVEENCTPTHAPNPRQHVAIYSQFALPSDSQLLSALSLRSP